MSVEALHEHLESCVTTVARAWCIKRQDGAIFGFTDHDQDLSFDGVAFVAETGMTARTLHQTTGLAVNNSEAIGALTGDRITEADINAGLYDSACVKTWLVNWKKPQERKLLFKGTLGEVRRTGASFEVELRGLTEGLNTPQGRVYQKPCSAVLGDGSCKLDLDDPAFTSEATVVAVENRQTFILSGLTAYSENWFLRGRLVLPSGASGTAVSWIKSDQLVEGQRIIETWAQVRLPIAIGDVVQVQAGCDKRMATCGKKFNNIINFQGFPHIPGEDWLMSLPSRASS